jgi:hypothetical protein
MWFDLGLAFSLVGGYVMIVAVTNCIAYEARVKPEYLYRNVFHHSLLTDGILRLLSGEILEPAKQTEKLPKYHFDPIDIKDIDIFIWSPFIDQAGYYVNMQNHDNTLYPYSDGDMCKNYGIVGKIPLLTVYLWWRELYRITQPVRKKIIILYPTDFLTDETPEKKRFKERVVKSNEMAKKIFYDWTCLTIENPQQEGTWWAHFTRGSKKELLEALEKECVLP